MFSLNDSLQEILNTSGLKPYLQFLFSADQLEAYPKE